MRKSISWYEPAFGESEKQRVCQVLDGGYVNEGPTTRELENQLAEYLGVRYVSMTTSGTAALYLALEADRRVRNLDAYGAMVPDLSMIGAVMAVEHAGGRGELADIRPDTYCIDVDDAGRRVHPATRSIIPVHVLGRAADLQALDELADSRGLVVIEDAAACLGSRHGDRYLGTFGTLGCFSLQANKIISTGQGGFVVTDDDRYAETIARIKNFGRANSRETLHEERGFNLKFNDILSAVALAQLERIDERIARLKSQWQQYRQSLDGVAEVRFPEVKLDDGVVPIYVDVLVQDRKNLVAHLNGRGIYPRECWEPVHRNPPYRHLGRDVDFPVSTRVASHALWLPNGPAVSNGDIDIICKEIKSFY